MNQFFIAIRNKDGRFEMAPNPGGSAIEGNRGFELYKSAARHARGWSESGRQAFVMKHYTQEDYDRDYPEPT